MTDISKEAVARPLDGVTPGPWVAGRGDMQTYVDGTASKWIYAGEQYVANASGKIDGPWSEVMANARFIAAARDLVPALSARLAEVERERDEWETVATDRQKKRLATEAERDAARAALKEAVQFLQEAVDDLKLEDRPEINSRGKECLAFLARHKEQSHE